MPDSSVQILVFKCWFVSSSNAQPITVIILGSLIPHGLGPDKISSYENFLLESILFIGLTVEQHKTPDCWWKEVLGLLPHMDKQYPLCHESERTIITFKILFDRLSQIMDLKIIIEFWHFRCVKVIWNSLWIRRLCPHPECVVVILRRN